MERESFAAVVVGPNALVRDGLARILSSANFRIVDSVSSLAGINLNLVTAEDAILLVVDAGDDVESAIGTLETFKQRHPSTRIVILAHKERLRQMISAFRAGASAYFRNDATSETFIKSIELVMRGETILPSKILTAICGSSGHGDVLPGLHVANHGSGDAVTINATEVCAALESGGEFIGPQLEPPHDKEAEITPRLSARERAVLLCLAIGDSNKVIARKLGIAEATVKVHVKAVLRKICVHNRTQAAVWAMNQTPALPPKLENGKAALEPTPVSQKSRSQNGTGPSRMN